MHLGNVQAVIMADCNYLKQTNDTKGHEFGDMLLQSVADGIKANRVLFRGKQIQELYKGSTGAACFPAYNQCGNPEAGR